MDIDKNNLSNTQKIFKKIHDCFEFYAGYHGQAFQAYNHYSNLLSLIKARVGRDIERLVYTLQHNNRRSNVYYANIETLKGLVLPQVPSLVLSLNPSKKTNEKLKDEKEFYDVCTNLLSVIIKNTCDNLKSGLWDSFKLDYLVTGRGVLWANLNSSTADDDTANSVSIDHVRWQDFAIDTKPTWAAVSWVARRLLFTPAQFREKFDVDEDQIIDGIRLDSIYGSVTSFDSFGDTSAYIEVWEYWDKPTKTQYLVSKQFNTQDPDEEKRYLISKKKFTDMENDYFFPTPQPPMLIYNGINLVPMSDIWTYINELTELSNITYKRSNLISSLHLRGYTDSTRANVVNTLSSSENHTEGTTEDDTIVSVPGFTPNPQDPLIYYVDNQPRLELLNFLQQEYHFLVERIYSLTGISEQMRNVTSGEDDETATSVRLKSKFGSRRLKEHQQRLLDYWTGILKILLHRICQSFEAKDFKEIFSYNFRDDNKQDLENAVFEKTSLSRQLEQVQQQMQEQQQQSQMQQQQMQAGLLQQPQEQEQQQQGQQQQEQQQVSAQPSNDQPSAVTPTENVDNSSQEEPYNQGGAIQEPQQVQQPQPQEQPQQPQVNPLEQQNQQLLSQHMDVEEKYENLLNEITWDRIIKFLRKDKLVSFLVAAHLDDLENKIIKDEKKNSDVEFMNTTINLINQILMNVNNNPQFADIYTSIFSLSLDNFDQTKSQRDSIDEFIKEVKKMAQDKVNNPQPQQPSPDDQYKMAQAQKAQAESQLIQAQIQEIQAKIQKLQADMQQPPQQPPIDNTAADNQQRLQELQIQHQNDMQLQQAKIQAEQTKYQDKMESDKQLLLMKIRADKERYQEKINSDIVDKGVNQQPLQ